MAKVVKVLITLSDSEEEFIFNSRSEFSIDFIYDGSVFLFGVEAEVENRDIPKGKLYIPVQHLVSCMVTELIEEEKTGVQKLD